jgi:hypothetical protein
VNPVLHREDETRASFDNRTVQNTAIMMPGLKKNTVVYPRGLEASSTN